MAPAVIPSRVAVEEAAVVVAAASVAAPSVTPAGSRNGKAPVVVTTIPSQNGKAPEQVVVSTPTTSFTPPLSTASIDEALDAQTGVLHPMHACTIIFLACTPRTMGMQHTLSHSLHVQVTWVPALLYPLYSPYQCVAWLWALCHPSIPATALLTGGHVETMAATSQNTRRLNKSTAGTPYKTPGGRWSNFKARAGGHASL